MALQSKAFSNLCCYRILAAAGNRSASSSTTRANWALTAAAKMLADAGPDILAFTAFPQTQWKQIWSNTQSIMMNVDVGLAA